MKRLTGIVLFVVLLAAPSFAATVFVEVPAGALVFQPRSIVIQVGDTVTWRNPTGGGSHGVQSDDGTSFSFPVTPAPWTFSHTFMTVGTFPYYCQIHGGTNGSGMSGIIFVGNRTQHAANEHILQLNAWDFSPTLSSSPTSNTGNTYMRIFPNGATIVAGVNLPTGSQITGIELEGCDQDATFDMNAQLLKCTSFSQDCPILAFAFTQGFPGCGYFSAGVNSETVDNLGNTYVAVINTASNLTAVRALRIYYRSAISYPPATATFSDVPITHPFYRFIEALVASGITAGCSASPPQYCPDTPLTRGQMAVFLARGLGLFWPN